MACINYLNLSTAQSIQRGKEVGVRKAAGAQTFQLIRQFLGESLLLTLFSMIIAVVLVYLLLPVFNNLVDSEGTIGLFGDVKFFFVLIISVLFIGLLSGSYPAFFISRFTPSTTLKGSSLTDKKGLMLRNILVVIQFSISIILIICTTVTSNQVKFLKNKKLGFTKDHIIVVPVKDSSIKRRKEGVKDELLKIPGITDVSFSSAIPIEIDSRHNYIFENIDNPEKNRIQMHYARVDYDFIDLFEMEIVKGRKFDYKLDKDKNAYIINEAVCKELGWDDPVGKQYGMMRQMGTVVGVVKNFHNGNMQSAIGPVTLELKLKWIRLMSIKVNTTDIQNTISAIEDVWKTYSSGYPFEYNFMDEQYDVLYKSEIRRGRSFTYFSFLAIFICCLGLFGVASFTIRQCTKEIGIRKVLGASTLVITRMLLFKTLKWIAIANITAFPVAYFFMNSWLQEYAYRIDLEWGTFLSSGFIAALIAFLTVITQTIKASRANPVKSLRYE